MTDFTRSPERVPVLPLPESVKLIRINEINAGAEWLGQLVELITPAPETVAPVSANTIPVAQHLGKAAPAIAPVPHEEVEQPAMPQTETQPETTEETNAAEREADAGENEQQPVSLEEIRQRIQAMHGDNQGGSYDLAA